MTLNSKILLGVIGYYLDDISCKNPRCHIKVADIKCYLINTLLSPEIIDFKYAGEDRLHPSSVHYRPVYEIVHRDNKRNVKIGFTGMNTIILFSKRNRRTHCYFDEFQTRLDKKLFKEE